MSDDKFTDEDRDKIIDALMAGNKIEAIKLYRDGTGQGLKEAKDYIEHLIQELGKESPEILAANKGTGCASVVLLVVTTRGNDCCLLLKRIHSPCTASSISRTRCHDSQELRIAT